MRASEFDEIAFFRLLDERQVRALLIGRRALVVLGLPVLTADYDFWIATDDIEAFNAVARTFELWPARPPEDARRAGRYVLENDEHFDALVARAVSLVDGGVLTFDEAWGRRARVDLGGGVFAHLPSLDDLIATKRFAARPKDLEDIRLLEALRLEGAR